MILHTKYWNSRGLDDSSLKWAPQAVGKKRGQESVNRVDGLEEIEGRQNKWGAKVMEHWSKIGREWSKNGWGRAEKENLESNRREKEVWLRKRSVRSFIQNGHDNMSNYDPKHFCQMSNASRIVSNWLMHASLLDRCNQGKGKAVQNVLVGVRQMLSHKFVLLQWVGKAFEFVPAR